MVGSKQHQLLYSGNSVLCLTTANHGMNFIENGRLETTPIVVFRQLSFVLNSSKSRHEFHRKSQSSFFNCVHRALCIVSVTISYLIPFVTPVSVATKPLFRIANCSLFQPCLRVQKTIKLILGGGVDCI